jgi:hypothetical protein
VVDDHTRLVAAHVEDAEPAVVARIDEVAVEREVRVRRAVLVGVADEPEVLRAGRGLLGLGRATCQLLCALLADEFGPRDVELPGLIRVCCGERRD